MSAVADAERGPDDAVARKFASFDDARLRQAFVDQGSFLFMEDFLPREVTQRLVEAVRAVQGEVHRNYLPGHKQGGSVSRHTIDRMAPFIAGLYRSPALVGWLEKLCGEPLLPSPDDDPHAYALYFYTRPGDHIGWHYDTSYYDGRRYTLLLGVVDDSSCRLEYRLHTRTPQRPPESGAVRLPPGGLAFFDGDRLQHRITPAGAGEERVSLTFEYVTNAGMRPWRRFVSNMKDAVAYFGFRQTFSRLQGGRSGDGRP
ncbi:hypothetical protein GCM10023144_18680 [Pigmentiphaga soli]|uniref:Fe2OG dioxygenase domain-containing protein n=1 Tax=Pigmentiphaga soli TaxID=1007095 RepID=A0ABP8GVY3_9BURK